MVCLCAQYPTLNTAPIVATLYSDIFVFAQIPLAPDIPWDDFRIPFADLLRWFLPWLHIPDWLVFPDFLALLRYIISILMINLDILPDFSREQVFLFAVSTAIIFSLSYGIFFLEPVRKPLRVLARLNKARAKLYEQEKLVQRVPQELAERTVELQEVIEVTERAHNVVKMKDNSLRQAEAQAQKAETEVKSLETQLEQAIERQKATNEEFNKLVSEHQKLKIDAGQRSADVASRQSEIQDVVKLAANPTKAQADAKSHIVKAEAKLKTQTEVS